MVQVRSENGTRTLEYQYQEMCERVATFTDKLGATVDSGIFETVVVLNLQGFHTFQSCEGHLDHGCSYPWVTIIDKERSRMFNKTWSSVCALEEQAKTSEDIADYNRYLCADVELRVLLAQWEADDNTLKRITELLDLFFAGQGMQTHPARLLVKQLHTGLYRIEPGFSQVAKELPEALKPAYLACGQAEMQAFASFLRRRIGLD